MPDTVVSTGGGVRVVTVGVQGPQGPPGPAGATPDLSAYARKDQSNTFTQPNTFTGAVSSDVVITVRGLVGQSGDLTRWQTSTGFTVAGVASDGSVRTAVLTAVQNNLTVRTPAAAGPSATGTLFLSSGNASGSNSTGGVSLSTGFAGDATGAGAAGNSGDISISIATGGNASGQAGSQAGNGGDVSIAAGAGGSDPLGVLDGAGGGVLITAGSSFGTGQAGNVSIAAGTNSSYTDPTKHGSLLLGTATTGIQMGGGNGIISIQAGVVTGETLVSVNEIAAGAADGRLFRVDFDGYVYSSEVQSGYSTLGTLVGRMRIYNQDGSFVGYMPVYDDIT